MKIAFVHNLQRSHAEAEAEFDTPETVAAIADALTSLGHEVVPIDVARPVAALVARLEQVSPDIVLNTAEGQIGRTREAFYPMLFEQLGLPYTGSDAHTCVLTLDKHLTKVLVAEQGVPTPGWAFVERADDPIPDTLRAPFIIKPNFEGSSKGITERSIVERREDLRDRLLEVLERYPDGVLVEEFITGSDLVVPFLELASPQTGGVLAAAEYLVAADRYDRRFEIYDYDLKHEFSEAVEVRAPAHLPPELAERLTRLSRTVYRTLNVRDLGRIDYRLTPDGQVYFLEVNALPSLEPGCGLYVSAALAGLTDIPTVLEVVLRSACKRHNIPYTVAPSRARSSARTHNTAASAPDDDAAPAEPPDGPAAESHADRLREGARIGFFYNIKRVQPRAVQSLADEAEDAEAEYDSPRTIDALTAALEALGHTVVPLEATPELLRRIGSLDIDVAFNLAEGGRGRGREALVPCILEMLDIPYTGSDAATMALCLDKAMAKSVVRDAGVPTPRSFVIERGDEPLPEGMSFPLMVKPVAEGSSKGVIGSTVATDEAQLREIAGRIISRYKQGALVETFLPGREFTVGLLSGRGPEAVPRVLPPMEIVFTRDEPYPVYNLANKLDVSDDVRYEVPARLTAAEQAELEDVARRAFVALRCRDVARIDLRQDASGRLHFIECNPLPGLTPNWSDLCQISNAAGIPYLSLIESILEPALDEWRQRRVATDAAVPEAAAGPRRRAGARVDGVTS